MKHKPKLKLENGSSCSYKYRDGHVYAVLSTDLGDACEIMEFSSHEPGKGNGKAAVAWLKQRFKFVAVSDPGTEEASPEAFAFWCNMVEAGLIDSMVDENGLPILENGSWVIENIDPDAFPDLHGKLASQAPTV